MKSFCALSAEAFFDVGIIKTTRILDISVSNRKVESGLIGIKREVRHY